jgi:hypothetical protein
MESSQANLFFLEQLTKLNTSEELHLSDELMVYIAGVLCRPVVIAHHEIRLRTVSEALGPRFLEAYQQKDIHRLREVGDDALLLRGFWWPAVEYSRFGPGPAYYEDLGRRAYLLIPQKMFKEMGDRFNELATTLALLWARTHIHRSEDLIMVYTWWARHGSRYARMILERHGMNLSATSLTPS